MLVKVTKLGNERKKLIDNTGDKVGVRYKVVLVGGGRTRTFRKFVKKLSI